MHNNSHRPPGFNSAWMSNQTSPENQHPTPYLAHDMKPVNSPNLKIPASGFNGLVNGDVCDSNTFLNYVGLLNQQRSNGIFVFDPRSNGDVNQAFPSKCQNCEQQNMLNPNHRTMYSSAVRVKNTSDEIAPTYRDASTNTTIKFPPDFTESSFDSFKNECEKCKTLKTNVTIEYNHLGLQPQKIVVCKNCGQSYEHDELLTKNLCTNCNALSSDSFEERKTSVTCKCVQDCDAQCVKNNRRLHFLDVDRPFTCEICLKNYPSESSLSNHLRYHKGNKPYQCDVGSCSKAFATNSHLTTHKRTHSGEKPFKCTNNSCFKTFSDRSSFVKHTRTHGPNGTTIKKYKCPICSNLFVDSCGLKKHIRIHTNERPYQCSQCNKSFSTSSTFVSHKRIHSGERPYSCQHCSKSFITKSHLVTHSRVHSGEKPFLCPVCHRAFADGSSFRRHERLHTGEHRYTCHVCGKGFPFETSLDKHKQSHVPGTSTYVYVHT